MPTVLKSGSLNLLEPSGPIQACNGIAFLSLPILEHMSCSHNTITVIAQGLHPLLFRLSHWCYRCLLSFVMWRRVLGCLVSNVSRQHPDLSTRQPSPNDIPPHPTGTVTSGPNQVHGVHHSIHDTFGRQVAVPVSNGS